jgi:cis-L-3-hydroxyproline dehydratase
MSGGRVIRQLDSTVVRITTDEGLAGWGEVCPLGSAYLPAHAEGARTALHELAPAVIGLDPTNLAAVNRAMDTALLGHAYAKSPVDIACWDLLGQVAGLPVSALLGGVRQERFPLYTAVPLGPAEEMSNFVAARRAEGVHHFQLKIGGDPLEDAARVRAVAEGLKHEDRLVGDANGGWRLRDALLAVRLIEDVTLVYLEQPCPTLAECRSVRAATSLPFVLDEAVSDVPSLLEAATIGGLAAINLKISKVGGLTKARTIRDVAEALGLALTIEDTWGGDVVTASVAHLAATVRPDALFTVSFMNDWTSEHVAGHQPRSESGWGSAPTGAGLGVQVDVEALGKPLFRAARAAVRNDAIVASVGAMGRPAWELSSRWRKERGRGARSPRRRRRGAPPLRAES